MTIDIRNQFVYQNCLKIIYLKRTNGTKLSFIGHTVSHNNDERFTLTFGNQIIHNQIGMSLTTPSCFVFSPTMLQVKYRELLFAIVSRWQINKCSSSAVCTWRWEQHLHYLSMRNILHCIEILVVCRNFDTAFPTYRTIIVIGTRVIHYTTIDCQVIIVETFVHRTFGCTYPNTVLVLMQHGTATAT